MFKKKGKVAESSILNSDEFVKKIEGLRKKENPLDLSSDQDLSIALMNLISIEEHFFFSGAKTGKAKYYDWLQEVRSIRKTLLKKIVPSYTDGSERWCISKHLLAASMRLMEVGTKQLDLGNNKDSEDLFKKAYDLYTLFWGVNLELLDLSDITSIDDNALNKSDLEKSGFSGTLGRLLQKVIDCCLE